MVAIDSTYEDPLRQVPAVAPDDLTAALDLADDDLLFARLRRYNHTGRRPYDVRSMWRAVLTKYLLGIRYNVELVALLRSNAAARDACGFDDGIPNESIVCRFFKRLTRHRGLVEDAVHRLVNRVAEAINERKTPKQPPAGLMMAIDSTDIESFCDVRSKPYTDPNAAWGHRTPKHHAPNKADDQGKKDEFFFGFKMHAVCDAYWGFPVAHIILPANQSDSPTLPTLTAQALKRHPHLKPRYLIADRGYDATDNYKSLDKQRILSVIHMRDTDKDGIYTTRGRPKCVGGRGMEYVETDQKQGHLFRCPPDGCRLKNKVAFTRYCNSEHYENPLGNPELLRKVGRLPRASKWWRGLYRQRTTIERWFNSIKASRLLTLHRYRGRRKIALHAALSTLTYLATMLARARAGDMENLRIMRIQPPTATSTTIGQRSALIVA